jgi:hypothetical protein
MTFNRKFWFEGLVMLRLCMFVGCAAALMVPATALAQGGWEVELHGGLLSTPDISGGSSSLPATGSTFSTGGPFESRRVPSWFFGDGAQLLNAIAGSNPGFNIPERITPLDPVVNNALADRKGGGSVGFRVSRDLTRRFAAEFNFDYAKTPFEARAGVQSGLDAASGSFRAVFENARLLPPVLFVGKAVTSTNSLRVVDDGSEFLVTGAVKVNVLTRGTFRPYVTAGAGVTRYRGGEPVASVTGGYSFRISGVYPMSESDTVDIRQTFDQSVLVGLVGGGVNLHLTGRSGIRVDVRAHLGTATDRTVLNTSPNVMVGVPPWRVASSTNPSLSFSSFPQPSATPSSLSGDAVTDFTTFEVSRTRRQVLIAFGYFYRF